ncbi:HlyC/CorC family transporter [Calidifontibacter sp. DB0510]|uniref:HlyC/CorC family transporter n=1 Tax=Metallococcus carri TaxID=1656884 RepID=A0A967E9H8_9MICO|nr:hemolysin family protein [Metallococcus carri]NHN56402.1 HlyC/CorC family transporter [Metallococcus carri]NOP36026.1 HlyC/CorC family transporter [Calidifontibacter sp. DB2511S]
MLAWIFVAVVVLLTVGTALFVAAEFSLVALDRPGVQRQAEAGDAGAGTVLPSLRSLSTQLSAAQVGITLTTLVLGFLVEPGLGTLLESALTAAGLPEASALPVSTVAALVIATLFSMIFGELIPQFLGISAPLRVAKVVARPVRIFATVTKPLIVILNGSANRLLRWMGIEPQEELSAARTPQELASMVRRSAAAGTMEEGTARLLTRSLGFGERVAADVMTPRVRCSYVDRSATAADVVDLARASGHSRFPVIDDGWDDVVGVVHVKKAIAVPPERRADVPVTALMVPPVMVPETARLDPLLLLLRASGLQLAIVIDEYAGTSGVVTLEDVIEEIVGEVSDEHDRVNDPSRLLPDGSWTVSGLWRPDEVTDRIGAVIPEGSAYETVGGFVMDQVGRVPQVGDEIALDGWMLRVVSMDRRRVDRVRLTPIIEATEDEVTQ